MNSTKVFSNLIWKFMERCGAQLVSLVVQIVLTRLLAPEEFGTITLITAFVTILQVFVDSGFGTALIQKKDSDDVDFSSVFYFNVAVCLLIYFLLYISSPLIASYYERPELCVLTRALGLVIIISGVRNIQQAYIARHMLFKRYFFVTLGGTVSGAVIGIIMAYRGYGVWALVAQTLSNNIVSVIILWFTVKWRPKAVFSLERLKGLFSFGWKLLVSSLLDTVFQQLRTLVIGKKYNDDDLAYFNKGNYVPNTIVLSINSSIESVMLSALSAQQDITERVRLMTKRSVQLSSYIMWPLMLGICACAEPLVSFVFTDKWLPCVPYIRIFCIYYALYPIHTSNLNAIKAVGRSDLFLKLEIIKKAVNLALLFATMNFGVAVMAYGVLAEGVISLFINALPNRKLIGYSIAEQLKDILSSALIALVMGGAVYAVSFLNLSAALTLLIQIPLGVIIYFAVSVIFKPESFRYLLDIVRSRHEAV